MEDLHGTIAAYLRARRGATPKNKPEPSVDPHDPSQRLTLLAGAYGQGWLTGIRQLPAFVQVIAAEAGEDRLAGMDEYPCVVRAEMRHNGPAYDDCSHSSAPSEAQQALRILRDARLWPWQRVLWRSGQDR
jgi:hypothetical protein